MSSLAKSIVRNLFSRKNLASRRRRQLVGLGMEPLENRLLLAADVAPWQNQALATDVNNDGHTSITDLAIVVNELIVNEGSRPLQAPLSPSSAPFLLSLSAAPAESPQDTMFYDVNGDNVVSITDLAMIVDQLVAINETAEAEVTTFTSASSDPTDPGQTNFFVGDTIFVHIFTQDLRTMLNGNPLPESERGIFGMTVDVTYGTEIDLVITNTPADDPSDFAVTFGSAFTSGLTFGDARVDGLINQLLATQSFSSRVNSADPMHWATLEFTATSAGTNLTVDITDDAGGEVTGVPGDTITDVDFVSTPFNIVASILAVDDDFPGGGPAIFEGSTTPVSLDVLSNDASQNGTLEIISTSNPAAQIVQGSPDTIDFTPPAGVNGTFMFDYTISDGTNQSTATVTVEIEPTNDPPVGVNDPSSTDEDTAIDIDVIANDTDVDNANNELFVSNHNLTSLRGATISLNPDGTLNYDPSGSAELQALGPTSTPVVDTFTYTVSDPGGLTDTATVSITVSGVNDAPVGVADSDTTDEDTAIDVDVIANDTDVDHANNLLVVSALDATSSLGVPLTLNGDGTVRYDPTLLPSLQTMGDTDSTPDTFMYTVSDPASGMDVDILVSITVDGVNDDPEADNDAETIDEDITTEFFPLVGDTDVDGGALTITDASQGTHGSVTFNAGSVTYDPDLDYNGDDSFTYTISDGNGGFDTATINVTIDPVNDAPEAFDDTITIQENELPGPIEIQTSFLTSDDNGGPADEDQTVTVVGVPANNMSDDGGTVILNGNGTISYTAPGNFDGEDTFTYTIEDSGGLQAMATVTVTERVINDPPLPEDDNVDVMEGTGRVIAASELLVNDAKGPPNESDQTLEITAVQTATAAGGTATLNGDGSITYTPPDEDFNGPDSFTYTVTDDGLTDGLPDPQPGTATVFVNVTTKNDAPVLVEDTIDATEGEPRIIQQSELLTQLDAPGPADESGQSMEVVAVNPVTHLGGSAVLNGDGTITYTPPDTNINTPTSELDIIEYTVRDNGQSNGVNDFKSATSRVNINIQEKNDTPTANGDARATDEDVDLVFDASTLTTNDSKGPANESDQTLTVTAVSATSAAGGTVSLVDGVITYSPPEHHNGPDSFTYTVTDDGTSAGVSDPLPDTATVTITVNPINDDPDAMDDSGSGLEDEVIEIDVLANDDDIDGDTPTIFSVTQGANGTVTFNGVINYTPNDDYNGPDTFTYTISDGNGGFDTADVTVEVFAKNDAPTAVDDRSIIEPDQTVLIISVADLLSNDLKGPANESGQALKVTSIDSPNGAAVLSQDGLTITYTKPGDFDRSDSFTYTIEDDGQTNGVDNFLTSTATVEVRNFFPSTISGNTFNDSNNDGQRGAGDSAIGGRTVSAHYTNIFGEEVTLQTTTRADGSYDFGEVVPGSNVQITMDQPLFLIDGQAMVGSQGGQSGDGMLMFDLAEDTNAADNNFTQLGRMPEYYSVADFLNTTPDVYAMFAVNPETGEQNWYSLSAGWEQVTDAEFSISQDLSTISLSVHDQQMNHLEANVAAMGNPSVEFLGQIGDWLLIRMAGGFGDFDFQAAPAPIQMQGLQLQSVSSDESGGESEGGEEVSPPLFLSVSSAGANDAGSQAAPAGEDPNAAAFAGWDVDDDDDDLGGGSSFESDSGAIDEALIDFDLLD